MPPLAVMTPLAMMKRQNSVMIERKKKVSVISGLQRVRERKKERKAQLRKTGNASLSITARSLSWQNLFTLFGGGRRGRRGRRGRPPPEAEQRVCKERPPPNGPCGFFLSRSYAANRNSSASCEQYRLSTGGRKDNKSLCVGMTFPRKTLTTAR